jgi:hypothetical protein
MSVQHCLHEYIREGYNIFETAIEGYFNQKIAVGWLYRTYPQHWTLWSKSIGRRNSWMSSGRESEQCTCTRWHPISHISHHQAFTSITTCESRISSMERVRNKCAIISSLENTLTRKTRWIDNTLQICPFHPTRPKFSSAEWKLIQIYQVRELGYLESS